MILSVASGKGGTGKTLVATSLALSLKDKYSVQLLDCDVEEPNAYIFVKPVITHRDTVSMTSPEIDENKCDFCGKCAEICAYKAIAVWGKRTMVFPELCHGCGACSYLCPSQAISEFQRVIGVVESGYAGGISFVCGRLTIGEAISSPVIRKVKEAADERDVHIIDCAPGTSCPVITAVKGSDYCLLVTEPTPFGLNDLTLAVEAIKTLHIPCGVVINRSCDNASEIIKEYCRKMNLPVLLSIPMDNEIACLYSKGITLAEGLPEWKSIFLDLFERVQEILNERNSCSER
ncbi:MAG: ATP-binding protein [Dehalococcoidales bacterium]|jgi:MinD superfamily P-loop ATPase|nr:ATP-binding protein [Dehalococcoidales bacterium]